MNKVLVCAVHPDDETLGCGGTILHHKANGDEVHWLIGSRMPENERYTELIRKKREKEIKAVSNAFEFDGVHQLPWEAGAIDQVSAGDLIGSISKIFTEVKPNIVYLPFRHDVHSDHRAFFDASFSCTKVFRYPFIEKVLMMETISETDQQAFGIQTSFIPHVFVNIENYFDKKISIMSLYESELGDHPFPRSIENLKALALHRGASSGFRYAESFMLLKERIG